MTDVIEALREGDIYRWSYRNPSASHGIYGSYHCCSRIAIVKNGRLLDTYWGLSGPDSRSFGTEALAALELTYIGNLSDLEKAPEYQADYYDDADIVDLNHSNSTRGNFYLRKGAVRSQKKMLEVANCRLEQSVAKERNAARRSDELRSTILRIQAGDLGAYI